MLITTGETKSSELPLDKWVEFCYNVCSLSNKLRLF